MADAPNKPDEARELVHALWSTLYDIVSASKNMPTHLFKEASEVTARAKTFLLSTPSPPVAAPPATPVDPMDTPLPCDVKIGSILMRAGVPLRTLVLRTQCLHDSLRERLEIPAAQTRPTPEAPTKHERTRVVLDRLQAQEDGHNRNPFRPLLERLMANTGAYSVTEIGQLKYALDGFYGAAQPQPQPAQPLTDEQIEALLATPANLAWLVSSKTERITLLIRAVERAHGITAPSTPTPPEVAP